MKLAAQKRSGKVTGALMPAVVYNKELNVPVSIDRKTFDRVFRQQGTASIIDLEVDGANHEVLVKQVQMDKRRRVPIHVDFYAVTAGQAVQVHVPIEFVGKAVGVKEGGQLDVQRREVFISILPRLIPQHVEVDISNLNVNESLHIGQIQDLFPAEAEILDDLELSVVAVVPPRVVAEDIEPVEEVEPEVIGEGEDDEDEDEE